MEKSLFDSNVLGGSSIMTMKNSVEFQNDIFILLLI